MGKLHKYNRKMEKSNEEIKKEGKSNQWSDGSLMKKPRTKREMNKLTREALSHAFVGSSYKIAEALEKLFEKDPEAYINAVAKLANYVLPKYSSAEIIDKTPKKVEINVGDMSVEELKNMMNNLDD